MRRNAALVCVVALAAFALMPVTAWAEDVPPTPMPPDPMPVAPMPPTSMPVMVTEMAPMPVPCEAPTPYRAPVMYERQGICPPVQMVNTGPVCCIARNAGGWPVTPGGCCYGRLVIWAEGLWSFLKAPEGLMGEAPYLAGPTANPDPIDWGVLDYDDGQAGGRFTVRYAVAPEMWIEARATYYGEYSDTKSESGRFGFMPGPAGVGGVTVPNTADLRVESEVYGGELNFWTEVACTGTASWSVGGGAHWVQFNEGVTASNWAVPFAPFDTPPYMRSYVQNTYIAAQFGGSVRWEITPCFDVTLLLKGMLGNMNRQLTVSDNSVFSGGYHGATNETNEVVAGVDVDVSVRWRLTRWLALTAGYNLLFVDNVLRAHDGMDFTKSNSGAIQPIDAADQLVVHSVLLGIQVQF